MHNDYFMQSRFGLRADAYPTHYLSQPEARLDAIRRSLGYGMVPQIQMRDALKNGALVDVAPGHFTDVALYWHSWAVQSPRMQALSQRSVDCARRRLLLDG